MLLQILYFVLSLTTPALSADCVGGITRREFRGVWLATVANIDWPKSRTASTSQNQAELISLLNSLQDAGFNAVIFQIRGAGDAFYQSSIEPWSVYLTGSQGTAPNPMWDPLEFIVKECHKRNMELHAWLNPYRAKSGSTSTADLASNNMAKAFPSYAYVYGSNIWMDPGSKVVQDRLNDVIMDVVRRYDIDGIHFDDYFYPYPKSQAFPDSHTYQAYRNSGGSLSLSDWRKDNVNKLIQRLSTNMKAIKPYVKFGISPFGIWKSGHPSGVVGTSGVDALYADARLWLQKGWLDYLAPQLYWQIDPPGQSFRALIDWWSDPSQNPLHRHIYAGVAIYRVVDSHHWPVSEITRQIQLTQTRQSRHVYGTIQFSAKYIPQDSHGITSALKNDVFKSPALPPIMYLKGVNPAAAPKVTASNGRLDWSGSDKTTVRSWAVYREIAGMCTLEKVFNVDQTSMSISGSGVYFVSAVNRLGVEVGLTVKVGASGTIIG